MADVDDADAAVPEHIDDAEQVFHFLLGQRGGRFIKDDDLGIVGNRLGNLHHLTLGNRKGAHDAVGVHVDLQFLEDLHGVLIHLVLIHHDAALEGVTAQPEVVHNTALEGLVQLLMHHGHAIFQCFLAVFKVDLTAFQLDGALVLGVDSEQAFHQGGFACAVFAHQRMDRSPADRERDMVQRLHARERFTDVCHLQQNFFTHAYSSFS